MPDNLRRVAIVTGAARGIGAATACRLARDGMAVAALDLEADACGATVDAIPRLAAKRSRSVPMSARLTRWKRQ